MPTSGQSRSSTLALDAISYVVNDASNASDGGLAGPSARAPSPAHRLPFSPAQDVPYRHTVLEPIGRFCSYFPIINSAIDKRNKKASITGASAPAAEDEPLIATLSLTDA